MVILTKLQLQNVIGDIPHDAVEVKVTHFTNPYYVQLYEVQGFRRQTDIIAKELQNYLHRYTKALLKTEPEIKKYTLVVLSCDKVDCIQLPNWICRGIVVEVTNDIATVLLLDYGTIVDTPTNTLIKYTTKYISATPLTYSVSMNNILPTNIDNFTFPKSRLANSDINLRLSKNNQWPNATIEYLKNLIASAKRIFFSVESQDPETNRLFGEFYLVIEDQNICLRKVLLHRFMAVSTTEEILETIKNGLLTAHHYKLEKGSLSTADSDTNTKDVNLETIKDESPQENEISATIKRSAPNESSKDKIMIHSVESCRRWDGIADSEFVACIQESLNRNGVINLRIIQCYMWPAINQGLNVVAINPKESGKSLGYAAPIASYVARVEKDLLELQKSEQNARPMVLVLCSSIEKANKVFEKFRMILKTRKNIKVATMYNGQGDDRLMTKIYNKPHILISTPPFFLRFTERYPNKIELNKLGYLVLDHADVILQKYETEFYTILKNNSILNVERQYALDEKKMQIITSGMLWTKNLEVFVEKFMENPYICIGSYVEAAAYCKVSAKMSLRDVKQKPEFVLNSLKDYTLTKTVIVCLESDEAEYLDKHLADNGIKTLLCHENMTVSAADMRTEWKRIISGSYPVLICTDLILPDLHIYDAEYLIHYTITETSRTKFNYRFSTLMDNFINKGLTNKNCKVLIIADNSTNIQFDGLMKILQRLGTEIPQDWHAIAKGISLKINRDRKNIPLCEKIKQFGICENNGCRYRHCVLEQVDAPVLAEITKGVEVKLKINVIHSATHFSARILEYVKNGKKHPLSNRMVALHTKIQRYYNDAKKRRLRNKVDIGDICIMLDGGSSDKIYIRVMVLDIVQRHAEDDLPKFVKVKVLDLGDVRERVSVNYLYEIPPEFVESQTHVLDIYVTNVAPFDDENEWNRVCSNAVFQWLKNAKADSYTYGKVVLQLGSNLWLDTLDIRTDVTGYSSFVHNQTVKDVIVKNGHGTLTDKHLKKLEELCGLDMNTVE